MNQPAPVLAETLAQFLQETRHNAAVAKTRTYLAIGGFKDESINSRLTNFSTQLRAYLIDAYRGSQITLLEREYVDTLPTVLV